MARRHASAAPAPRSLRVGELIRRHLSAVLSRGDLHDPDLDRASITVGEVRVSPDLRQATVFVLPLGGRNAEAVLSALARNKAVLRRTLGKALRLKYTPDLTFRSDALYDRMDETRALLSSKAVRRDLGNR
ncbi:MAG: 30S ribosome-binding factor RbfA [Pseudomonadota bacterium]